MMDWQTSVLVACVFALAGLVKGVVGLGLPTVSMALLSIWVSPAMAAAWLVVPSMVTNLWQLRPWKQLRPLLRQLAPMQIGVVLGTLWGARQFGALASEQAHRLLGAALVAYALWGLWGRSAATAERPAPGVASVWVGAIVGVLTGVVTALTGVFVVPAVPYLQSLQLGKEALIQAMGLSFSVSTMVLAISLQQQGGMGAAQWGVSLLWLLPALAGMWLGERLRGTLSPVMFKRCLFGSLLLLGSYMLLR
ncbi:MAG: sulfite exporter TauE/SafE family protein [Comamonas sp.]